MSKIKIHFKTFKKWWDKDYQIKNGITFDKLFKYFAIFIPVYGILYLNTFYSQFDVDYFIYFNPLDFFKIFYEKNKIMITIIVWLCILFIINLFSFKKKKGKLKWNSIFLIVSLVESILLFFILFFFNIDFKILICLFFLALLVNYLGFCYFKTFDFLIFIYLCLFLLFTFIFAKDDAKRVKNRKYSFDIILNDNSYLLREKQSNFKGFYIGNTIDYFFIYDNTIKKIRALEKSGVKEIRFKSNKILTKE